MRNIINELEHLKSKIENSKGVIDDQKYIMNNGTYKAGQSKRIAGVLELERLRLDRYLRELDALELNIKVFFDELPEGLQNEVFTFIRGQENEK